MKSKQVYFIPTATLYFILIFMVLLSYEKRTDAANIISQPLQKEVSFFYKDREVTSSPTKVFLGKTADYIFLRNFERKENYIYKISEISELHIRDLRK